MFYSLCWYIFHFSNELAVSESSRTFRALFIVFGELIPHVAHSHHKGLALIFVLIGVVAVVVSGMLEGLV